MLCEQCGRLLPDFDTVCPWYGHGVNLQTFDSTRSNIESIASVLNIYTDRASRELIQGNDLTGVSTPAYYFCGIEPVDGMLHFKQDRLIFNPNYSNSQADETLISYASIEKIVSRNTLGILADNFLIVTKDSFEHKFIVNNQKVVTNYLQENICC